MTAQGTGTAVPATRTSGGPAAGRLTAIGERAGSMWTLGVLVLIVVVFSLVAPNFHTKEAWIATSLAATEVVLLALGQAFVIVGRGIDLSVGANLGLSGMVSGLAMSRLMSQDGLSQPLVIAAGAVVAVLTGALVGTVNGLVVTRLRVSPLIATLGMMGAATGVTQLANDGQEMSDLPSDLFLVGNTGLLKGWVPVPSWSRR
ncbi:ABC transporter permease [Microbispora sp. GKU 823]|uniref:ABC transporter permease n=1 Tax=Microbispora sp. GKU 823 TaxID=1652100 RepID=UPI0009A39069|nr:hypothetical protein [Microbispora sp. GKU 823]